jgi:hypothetical protein
MNTNQNINQATIQVIKVIDNIEAMQSQYLYLFYLILLFFIIGPVNTIVYGQVKFILHIFLESFAIK